MLKIKFFLLFVYLFSASSVAVFSQTPTPTPIQEEKITVVSEEIKINATAFDANGDFVPDVRKEDLVIVEDGRLQQASSARRVPANVLILLDTGDQMRGNLSATRAAAKNLVNLMQAGNGVSVFQFNDRVEMLSDWTSDKTRALEVLDKKLSFGRRSSLNQAINTAVEYFYKTPLENRHLVLITGGMDSFNDAAARTAATANLAASDINVHVVSLTNFRRDSIAARKSIFLEGEYKPRRLPEEVVETLPDPKGAGKKKQVTPRDMAKMPRLGSITLDRERIKRAKKDGEELEAGEQFLAEIAESGNGEMMLPETAAEAIEKTTALAKIIDSQYVVTYVPKRPLKDSPSGEVRRIEVSSKRDGLQTEARRTLVVKEKD